MDNYNFYVLECEDGEIYVCETLKDAEKLKQWYIEDGGPEPDLNNARIKGGFWEMSIA